jgi:hypothetical protein
VSPMGSRSLALAVDRSRPTRGSPPGFNYRRRRRVYAIAGDVWMVRLFATVLSLTPIARAIAHSEFAEVRRLRGDL